MAVEQALQGFRETETGESFSLQNQRMLKVELADVTIQAKLGAMVAYQGEVKFERAGTGGMSRLMKKVATGEGASLMKVSGTGEVFLAFHAQEVHLLKLGTTRSPSTAPTCSRSRTASTGTSARSRVCPACRRRPVQPRAARAPAGWRCSPTGHHSLEIEGRPRSPTRRPRSRGERVKTTVKTDVNLKTLIGRCLRRDPPDAASGDGWLLVQPSEGLPVAPAAARRRAREPARRLDHLAPEGVDAGVPLVRDLLEGLVGLLSMTSNRAPGISSATGRPSARAGGRVAAAGEDERRGGDLGQAVGRVVVEEGVEVALQVLGLLLVREGEHLLDELVDGPVVVCPRRCRCRGRTPRGTRARWVRPRPAIGRSEPTSGSRGPSPARCSAGRGCGRARGGAAPAPGRRCCRPRSRRRGRRGRRARGGPGPRRRP